MEEAVFTSMKPAMLSAPVIIILLGNSVKVLKIEPLLCQEMITVKKTLKKV